jgi:hypothetical protein
LALKKVRSEESLRILTPPPCHPERPAGEGGRKKWRFPQPKIFGSEIDYYNVKENRIKVYERDSYKCRYCEKQLTRFTATLDHVKPVAEGGDNSFDNLLTACWDCNSTKNRKPLGDFLADRT